jgi:hypothetical protein
LPEAPLMAGERSRPRRSALLHPWPNFSQGAVADHLCAGPATAHAAEAFRFLDTVRLEACGASVRSTPMSCSSSPWSASARRLASTRSTADTAFIAVFRIYVDTGTPAAAAAASIGPSSAATRGRGVRRCCESCGSDDHVKHHPRPRRQASPGVRQAAWSACLASLDALQIGFS